MTRMVINFDMDGTIANFYGQENWLDDLINENTRPYANAKPLVNMNALAKRLNHLQALGYEIGIISWLSKNGSVGYNEQVTRVKMQWLAKHLHSVNFNHITIVEYGTPKENYSNGNDVLFDDEKPNRDNWNGMAFDVDNIMAILEELKEYALSL